MRLRRIGVLSTGMVLGAIYAGLGLLFGLLFFLFSLLGVAAGAMMEEMGMAGVNFLFGFGAIIMLPIFYGVIGFIGGIIVSAIYNLVAGITGGLVLEFEKTI